MSTTRGGTGAARAVAKAGLVQLVFLIYGASCGGAFGVEEMISGSGPGIAILTLILVPFVFCLPVAFAVSELTCAFPVEGGNYRWSRMAFGDFWGFQAGWWSWMTGVVTNVIFAVLFANYFLQLLPPSVKASPAGGFVHWCVCLALIWAVYWMNVRGIELVGESAIVLSVLLLIPFVIMTAIGLTEWQHAPLTPFIASGKNPLVCFASALSLAIFLYSGYDKLSAAAEEVEEPQRTFPPALLAAVVLAIVSYVLPTLAALAARGQWQDWKAAYFPTVADQIGGPHLALAMTLAGLCSNALLLNVTMLAVSRIPLTLAEDGFLPAFLERRHPAFGTPVQALFWGSVAYSALTILDFTQLLIINAWFQMTTNLLIYANVWRMRRTQPGADRAFVIPGGLPGLLLCTVVTWLLALVAIGSTFVEGGHINQAALILGAGGLFTGIAAYWIASVERRLGWAAVDPRRRQLPAGRKRRRAD